MLASNLPASSQVVGQLSGGDSQWGISEQLLALIVDVLNGANWQRSGGKGPKPKPLERPGQRPEKARLGGTRTYSIDEMRHLLDTYSRN